MHELLFVCHLMASDSDLGRLPILQCASRARTRSRRNYNFKLLFFVAALQRARPKWPLFAAVTRCVSAVFFLAIRRYLPVVMFFNDDGAEQPNPFRVSKKIFSPEKNIQCQRARISRFPTIFRLATTKQTKKDLRCFTPNFTT